LNLVRLRQQARASTTQNFSKSCPTVLQGGTAPFEKAGLVIGGDTQPISETAPMQLSRAKLAVENLHRVVKVFEINATNPSYSYFPLRTRGIYPAQEYERSRVR
jgi:hypothetical protein